MILQSCDHECVCWWYYEHKKSGNASPCASTKCHHRSRQHNPQAEHEKVLAEYNDFLLTKLVQELAGTWRMRDEKLFSIIRKYRRVPIGAMKADLRQSKDGEP